MSQAIVRPALEGDAAAIVAIYNHYIRDTVITFEEVELSVTEMAARMREVSAAGFPFLVVEDAGHVLGYAYASKWKLRSAYRYSVETTVYVKHGQGGQGHGRSLYGALLPQLKERGIHAAVGGIALPNAGSVALHEKMGFAKVAHFREIGFKLGQWIDVGYWQCVL